MTPDMAGPPRPLHWVWVQPGTPRPHNWGITLYIKREILMKRVIIIGTDEVNMEWRGGGLRGSQPRKTLCEEQNLKW